jgi:hypothetical protein
MVSNQTQLPETFVTSTEKVVIPGIEDLLMA